MDSAASISTASAVGASTAGASSAGDASAVSTVAATVSTTSTTAAAVTPPRKRIFVPPTRKRARELTREDRARIKSLRDDAHWSYVKIAQETGFTMRQVQWACTHPPSPQKSKAGRRPLIRTPEKQLLKEWIEADAAHGRVPWRDLRRVLPPPLNKYGEDALSTALRSLGFKYVGRSRRKVPDGAMNGAGRSGERVKRQKVEGGEEAEDAEGEVEVQEEDVEPQEVKGEVGGGEEGQEGQGKAREQPSLGD